MALTPGNSHNSLNSHQSSKSAESQDVILYNLDTKRLFTTKRSQVDKRKLVMEDPVVPRWDDVYQWYEHRDFIVGIRLDMLKWTANIKRHLGRYSHICIVRDKIIETSRMDHTDNDALQIIEEP